MRTDFEWTYEPKDLFEQAEDIDIQGIIVRVEDGVASARAPGDRSRDLALRDALQIALLETLLGQGVARRMVARLSQPAISVLDEQGNCSVLVTLTGVAATCVAGRADVIERDSSGRVISDTKAERLARQAALRALIVKWTGRDTVLDGLITLNQRAAEDSETFLVHLYGTREAIKIKFGSESKAKIALDVSAATWSRLGVLTNELPLQEGRHAGKHHEVLRPATDAERHEAWCLAEELIEAYLRWLERGGGNK